MSTLHYPLEDVWERWRNASSVNAPSEYLLNRQGSSEYVADLVESTVGTDAKVVELGCNCGPNLSVLHERGFNHLTGVEINEDALTLLRETFPTMKARLRNVPIEQFVRRMGHYDLAFSVAVLEHVHYDSDWIFAKLAKRCSWILTVEDEGSDTAYHFPRNYGRIFGELGMEETFADHNLNHVGLGANFAARLFKAADDG